jgi:hypothetical protein
LECFIGNQQ